MLLNLEDNAVRFRLGVLRADHLLSAQLAVSNNISIVPLPAKCPELSPRENMLMAMNMPEHGRSILYGVIILGLLLLHSRDSGES